MRLILSLSLAAAPAAGPIAAYAADEPPAPRQKAACEAVAGRFTAVTLAELDRSLPAEERCRAASTHYEELRSNLLAVRSADLVGRVRTLGRELSLPDADVDALVPRYQEFQNALLAARATWKDGRYLLPGGKEFTSEQWGRLALRAGPATGETARAFNEHNQELLAIQDLASKGDKKEAAARLGRLLEGLGQRPDLLERGFGTAPMENTLAMVKLARENLTKSQRAQVDRKLAVIDPQLRAIAAKKIEVPSVKMGKAERTADPMDAEASIARLGAYSALAALPGTSGWAREKLWEVQTATLLKADKSVSGYSFSRKDPWGGGREGVEIVYKDGARRYESMDSPPATRLISADGRKVVENDPRRGYFSQAEDGKVTVYWERDKKTGRVGGRFRGMEFTADSKDTIFLSSDGDKLFIARGKDKNGCPKVREWLGVSRQEHGRMVEGLGQVVVHKGEGVFHEDAVLDPALTRRIARGEKVDLSALGLKNVRPETLKRLEIWLADLPQFSALFEMSFKGSTQKQGGVETSNWVESLYIRDGELHVVLGAKDGPAGSKPGYRQLVAVVDREGGQEVLKAYDFSKGKISLWKFSSDMTRCDQFAPDADAKSAGRTAFNLSRRMVKSGGKWIVAERIAGQISKEWTSWDTIKAIASSALGTVGDGVGVVFSPFQTALYGLEGGIWMAGGAIGSAVDKESSSSAFAKVSGVYTLRQAKFNEWLGSGAKGEAQILEAYGQANSVINETTRKDLRAFLDGEVDKGRRRQYGELYRFHKDDPVTERDRAYTAARVFGLGNMSGQYFEQGRESWEGGKKGAAALQYGAGIFVVGGEAFVEGAGFGLAAQPLKMMAVGGRTGQSVEQVSAALRKAAQGAELSKAESASVQLMKTMGRAELGAFLTPAVGGGLSDVSGLVRAARSGDKEGMWASVNGLAGNVGAFAVGFGLSFGQGMAAKRVEDFIAAGRPRPVEPAPTLIEAAPVKVEPLAAENASASLLAKLDVVAPEKAQVVRAALETDAMTGVPNRSSLERAAPVRIEKVLAAGGEPVVSILDMNNFGSVNEGLAQVHGPTGGTARADGILAKAAGRLDGIAKQFGVEFGRFGGEEFVVVGDKPAVLKFIEATRIEFADGQSLRDAGVSAEEMASIRRAFEANKRVGQIGDFTMGAAPARSSLGFADALHQADSALSFAKQNGGRSKGFVAEGPAGAPAFAEAPAALSGLERFEVKAQKLARGNLVSGNVPTIAERMETLRGSLGPQEFAEFSNVAFRDGLTQTRTKEFVDASGPGWKQKYPEGTPAAMVSARGLKTINDALGHEAGDAYLSELGRVVREVVAERRAAGRALEDPIRYASKDFLFIGEGASDAAAEAAARMETVMRGDSVLRPDRRASLESWGRRRGESVPADLGTLRAVTVAPGEATVAGKLAAAKNPISPVVDELVRRLDDAKKTEQSLADIDPDAAPAPAATAPLVGLHLTEVEFHEQYRRVGDHWYSDNGRVDNKNGIIGTHTKSALIKLVEERRFEVRSNGRRAVLPEIDVPATVVENGIEHPNWRPVPGLPGMSIVEYRMRAKDTHGQFLEGFKQRGAKDRYFVKTIIDEKIWTPEKIAELGESVLGPELREFQSRFDPKNPAMNDPKIVKYAGGLRYTAHVDATGRLTNFVIDPAP